MKLLTKPTITMETIAFNGKRARILKKNEDTAPGEQMIAGRKTWNKFTIQNYSYNLAEKIPEISLIFENHHIVIRGVIGLETKNNITTCICDYAIYETN
jgi:hypothetical protein